MSRKKALITGIAGQDGSFLAERLLAAGYEVHGVVRRTSIENQSVQMRNLVGCIDRIKLHAASLDNHMSVYKVVQSVMPDELYHLAASSFVTYSFDDESSILTQNFSVTHYLLSSVKELKPACRIYFAGSSEMFGEAKECPQNESTALNPRSIYGIAKVASHHLVRNYRSQYGIFACTGFLYNHESYRRGMQFVTRKITRSAARIKLGLQDKAVLGNLDALRDWGYAPDYVAAMQLMLNADQPRDYVIATGKLHSVRQFCEKVFNCVGLNYADYVEVNKDFFRPSEDVPLSGDASRAIRDLGWSRTKELDAIIAEMVEHDLKEAKSIA